MSLSQDSLSSEISDRVSGLFSSELDMDLPDPDTDLLASNLLDSFAMTTLVLALEDEFDIELPLEHLDLDWLRTVNAITETVSRATLNLAAPRSELLLLQPGEGAPILLAPGLSGNPLGLLPLAQMLSTRRPVYGVQAWGTYPDGDEPTVEAVAERMLEAVLSLQEREAFTLIGFSFGGAVVFHMAYLLRALGYPAPTVVLIDTGMSASSLPAVSRFVYHLGQPFRYLRTICRRPRTMIPFYARKAVAITMNGMKRPAPRPPGPLSPLERELSTLDAAKRAYVPPDYDGPVQLLETKTTNPAFCPPSKVWTHATNGNLSISYIPGTHDDLISENSGTLATALNSLVP